jgi:hypothetical protein
MCEQNITIHFYVFISSLLHYETSVCKQSGQDIVPMRFVAFPATEYDEVLLGYQPGQMVEW